MPSVAVYERTASNFSIGDQEGEHDIYEEDDEPAPLTTSTSPLTLSPNELFRPNENDEPDDVANSAQRPAYSRV